MSFVEAMESVSSNFANFSGRARRSEYWYFALLVFAVGVALGILNMPLLGELWTLVTLVPSLAVTWRRLHDVGKSGMWSLIAFVPMVGAIILLIWTCKDSQYGDNEYGPNPKMQDS